jgi:hypothetical protein
MSALTLGTIPSNINTYERLVFWGMQCLQSIANGEEVIVNQNQPVQPIANAQIARTADGKIRAICVAYLPIDVDELNSSTEKTWMAAVDISTATPHALLLTN